MFFLGLAGWNGTESVAEGGAGYFVKNKQIMEASSFFLPFLSCLLNPALFDFLNVDALVMGFVTYGMWT